MPSKNTGVWAVHVSMTVEAATPDEAIAFVQAELARKLPTDEQEWHTNTHHLLPKYEVANVRGVSRLNERGEVAG